MTYEEYLELEERSETKHEYIDGNVVAMAGGTIEHARLAANMAIALGTALKGRPCIVLSSDARVRIAVSNRATYPDISVVCTALERASDDRDGVANPTVVVEVFSESTESYDRGEKFEHFQRLASLQEYVLVSQKKQRIEVFRRQARGWLLDAYGVGETVELQSIGVRIAVDDIYFDPFAAS